MPNDDDELPEDFWQTKEGEEATERLEGLLKAMDSTAPQGAVREFVEIGTAENGEPFGFVAWRTEEK